MSSKQKKSNGTDYLLLFQLIFGFLLTFVTVFISNEINGLFIIIIYYIIINNNI